MASVPASQSGTCRLLPVHTTPSGHPAAVPCGVFSAAQMTSLLRQLPRAFARSAPVVAVAVVALKSATDFLPDTPFVSVLTPLRLIILCGLAALLLAGARLAALRTRLDIPVAVLLIASVGITFIGGRPAAPLRALLTEIAVYYLVVGLLRTQPKSWRALALLALISVSAAGLVAIAQVSNQTPTGFCRSGLLGDTACGHGTLVRAVGTFANPNALAAFLLLLAPIALLATALVTEHTTRIVVFALAVAAYGAIVATFSRAGYIGAAAGLLALAAAHWLAPHLSRRQLQLATGLGVAGLIGVTLLIAVASQAGNALGVRSQAWAAAIRAARAHPLGVGLGRAGAAIDATAPGGEKFVHAHNLWLNWLVETGVLGLIAIIAVTIVGVVSAAQLAWAGSRLGAAGLAGLAGFYLMSLLDHPANLSRIAFAWWLVLAVVMAKAPAHWRRTDTPPAIEESAAEESSAERPTHGAHRDTVSARTTVTIPRVEDDVDPTAETRPLPRVPAGPVATRSSTMYQPRRH